MSFLGEMKDGLRDAFSDVAAEQSQSSHRAVTEQSPPAAQRFEYDVVELREKYLMAGHGSAPTDGLRGLLNDRARAGWQLKHIVQAEVAGMVTKRDGWMVILEREIAWAREAVQS